MDRRSFLRSSCQACAAFALTPAVVSMQSCASGAKMLTVENGMLTVPMDTLGMNKTAVVSGQGLANKLLIVKRDDGTYTALELLCPHKGGPLNETGSQLECEWHHSRFDLEGKVLGGPAKANLKTYPVEVGRNALLVKVA